MNSAIEVAASVPHLGPLHRRVTGLATVAAALGGRPALLNEGGNALRNLGLLGMGLVVLRGDDSGREA
jgi:hypothetical protein